MIRSKITSRSRTQVQSDPTLTPNLAPTLVPNLNPALTLNPLPIPARALDLRPCFWVLKTGPATSGSAARRPRASPPRGNQIGTAHAI